MFCLKRNAVTLCLVFLVLFSLPGYLAAMMVGLATEELAGDSDTVIIGTVEYKESSWSADGETILTSVLVMVDETVKGSAPEGLITVEYEGGEVGDIGLRISDTPSFEESEKVLLFLKPERSRREPLTARGARVNEVFRVVGKAQGKYSIDRDGIARKKGFSVADKKHVVDNDISVDALVKKIRNGARQ